MTAPNAYDAIVIGSGPNGLAAAITLARGGAKVLVREANDTVGGAARSMELTLPGYVHDVGATVIALGAVSPFLNSVPLAELGVRFVSPPVAVGHPLDAGGGAMLAGSVDATAATLGDDADGYRRLLGQAACDFEKMIPALLGPPRLPQHPLAMARFGLKGIRSARGLADAYLKTDAARGLFAGVAAHSVVPLEWAGSAAFGLLLSAGAHVANWPVIEGGTQRLSDALATHLRQLGGEVTTGAPVESIDSIRSEYPGVRAILCDVPPRNLLKLAGDALPLGYRRKLEAFKLGPGAFKLDWALDAPVTWTDPRMATAGTLHLGGTLEEIADAERAVWQGDHHPRPFVLLVQPTLFDPTRAPPGKHTLWAYCHVPNGSTHDMTNAIEKQIERYAPGFRERVLARSVLTPRRLEERNRNLLGGDVNGGAQNLAQIFARPVASPNPHATPVKGLYLCSSSTPPGSGVHGMCGYHAARLALRREFGVTSDAAR